MLPFFTALAGLALTYALQALDLTQYSARLASDVENVMTLVERAMKYTEIDSEPGYSTKTRPRSPTPGQRVVKKGIKLSLNMAP